MTIFLFMIIVGDGLQICMDLTNFNPRKFFVKFYILYCISEINFFVKLIFSRSFNIWRTKILLFISSCELSYVFFVDFSLLIWSFLYCISCMQVLYNIGWMCWEVYKQLSQYYALCTSCTKNANDMNKVWWLGRLWYDIAYYLWVWTTAKLSYLCKSDLEGYRF